jgi:hypothetical protein
MTKTTGITYVCPSCSYRFYLEKDFWIAWGDPIEERGGFRWSSCRNCGEPLRVYGDGCILDAPDEPKEREMSTRFIVKSGESYFFNDCYCSGSDVVLEVRKEGPAKVRIYCRACQRNSQGAEIQGTCIEWNKLIAKSRPKHDKCPNCKNTFHNLRRVDTRPVTLYKCSCGHIWLYEELEL